MDNGGESLGQLFIIVMGLGTAGKLRTSGSLRTRLVWSSSSLDEPVFLQRQSHSRGTCSAPKVDTF